METRPGTSSPPDPRTSEEPARVLRLRATLSRDSSGSDTLSCHPARRGFEMRLFPLRSSLGWLGAPSALGQAMDCQHCGKKVSIFRVLTDGQYCCETHRWMHLKEINRLGLALLMRQAGTSEQRTPSAELPPASTFVSSGRACAGDAGSRDLTESPCCRVGARVVQPPLIV
jgi:hypothetical protein